MNLLLHKCHSLVISALEMISLRVMDGSDDADPHSKTGPDKQQGDPR